MLDSVRHSFEPSLFKAAPIEAELLLALLGRELAGAEGLIEGMSNAGLGVDAIAAYLGCPRTTILDQIEDRGIPISPDQLEKPFRPRKNAWSPMDHTLFIVGWTCGAHVPALAELLGRSAGSLYGKRRRIGLPTRRAPASGVPRKTKRQTAPDAASASIRVEVVAPPPAKPQPARRKTTPEGDPMATTHDASEPQQKAALIQPPPTPREEPRVTPSNEPLATSPTGSPCDAPIVEPPVEIAGKEARTRRQTMPSTLSAETQPEWHAAVEDFMTNFLPKDVDVSRHHGTLNYVISAVAILGGLKKTEIEKWAGFSLPRVGSHVERLHLSSKGATSETFDRQKYDEAMKVLIPKADGVTHRLIFHTPGVHRTSVTVKRAEKRSNAARATREQRAIAAASKREEEAWAAGIEIRRGVSLPKIECLSRPFDINI